MLKFEYRLTKQDLLEANYWHFRSSRTLYLWLWLLSILVLLSGIAVLVLFARNGVLNLVPGLVIIMIATSLNPEPQINIFQRQLIGNIWKQNVNLHHSIAVEVTEAGLMLTRPNATSRMNWQVFSKFLETPNLFLTYQSPQLFNIFPKRVFVNPVQTDEFRSLLQTHIQNRSQ